MQKQTINIKEKKETYTIVIALFGTSENDIVMNYYQKGYTIRQIADITNISKSKVFRIIKANNQNNMPSKTINIKEEYESNKPNDEVRVKGIKRVYAIRRKRPITSEAEEKENNVIKAL